MNEFRPTIQLEARQLMAGRVATGRSHHRPPSGTRRHRLARRLRSAADRLDG